MTRRQILVQDETELKQSRAIRRKKSVVAAVLRMEQKPEVKSKSFNQQLPEDQSGLAKAARRDLRRQRRKARMQRWKPFSSGAFIVLSAVCVLSVGFAFFSDFLNNSVAKVDASCLQMSSKLAINGSYGDQLNIFRAGENCVPADYTAVDSIHFDGNSYIDTGVDQTGNIMTSVQFSIDNNVADNETVFGARSAPNADNFALTADNSQEWGIYYGGQSDINVGNRDTPPHTFVMNNNRTYMDGGLMNVATSAAPTTPVNIYLGAFNDNGTPLAGYYMLGKVFSFNIQKDNQAVVNLIPVIQNSTGDCGMFDTVTNQFLGNAGSGTITCTPPAPNPNCDNLLCHGRAQGDTGVQITPRTAYPFTYELANTGKVDYQNYTGDKISAWIDGRYAPIPYIHFDNESYIDSGITQTNLPMNITADFQYDNAASSSQQYGILFGARVGSTSNALLFNYNNTLANFRFTYGPATTTAANLGTRSNNRCQLAINLNAANNKQATIAGCGTPANTGTTFNTVGAPTVPLHMFIGGLNDNGTFNDAQDFLGKIYSFTITVGGVLHNYRPIVDTHTGQCGLWDTAINQPLWNLGSGTIDCPNPSATTSTTYSPISYLQFTGTQYIDTGVDQNGNLAMNINYNYDSTSGLSYIFGSRAPSSNGLWVSNIGYVSGNYISSSTTLQNPTDTSQHTIGFDTASGWTFDGTAVGTAPPSISNDTSENIWLGAQNNAVSPGSVQGMTGKIYSFSIDKDGSLNDRDMIPVQNTATGECGMFDQVQEKFYGNAGTGTIGCGALTGGGDITVTPPSPNPLKILLYPASATSSTISSDLSALDGGATTAPSSGTAGGAIATIDGSACSSTFYGTDAGISPVCKTGVLTANETGTTNTLGVQTAVNAVQDYAYQFVVWEPTDTSSVYYNNIIYFGVTSGAQGLTSINTLNGWKQQAHPFVSATVLAP